MPNTKTQVYIFHNGSHASGVYNAIGAPIDANTAVKMVQQINNTPAPDDFCLGTMISSLQYKTRTQTSAPTSSSLSFTIYTDFNEDVLCKCSKDSNMNKYCGSLKAKSCAKNFAAGKCRDEYMRKTIGAILYPQYYATEKQK